MTATDHRRLRGHDRPGTPSIAILSTYGPTPCGLATFSSALAEHLVGRAEVGVVRVVDHAEHIDELRGESHSEVIGHLLNGSPESAADTVHLLNGHDVALIQHEYGIYGGADGQDVLAILEEVTVPKIVVLHTVLQQPTPRQRDILLRLLARADVVVTMTQTARQRLADRYAADVSRTVVIPHGAIDHGRVRASRGPSNRPLVLTWGLLGPGKGIEWAIDAMPGLRDLRPRYLVVGRTHPKVVQRDGESYRESLLRRVEQRGVTDLVELDGSYVGVHELAALVAQASVVLLPYDSREQVTSGVLIEAVAAGRPVVSTAFPHAVELLGDGAGLVVPQGDPAALGSALRRVLREPGLAEGMSAQAARQAPELLWGSVAQRYAEIAHRLTASALVAVS